MNILLAVTKENKEALREVLDLGWGPPKIKHRCAGLVSDYAIWTEVILRDWREGLEILHEFYPDVSLSSEIFEIALKNCSSKCVEFLWRAGKFQAENISLEQQRRWVQWLLGCMGEPWSMPHEIKDVTPVYLFLSKEGVDLSHATAGKFEVGDLRLNGHSLWTRAIMLKNWDFASQCWPNRVSEWSRWPRLNEVLSHLISVLVGDYRSLMEDHKKGEFPEEEILFRWLEDFSTEWLEITNQPTEIIDEIHPQAVSGNFDDLLGEMYEPIPTENENFPHDDEQKNIPLYRFLVRPNKEKIAPFLRLPMMLQQDRRQKIWSIWSKILSVDPELSWLHEIAMYPDDHDVQELILLARHDQAIPFHRFWARKSASGFSPHERWINMGGDLNAVKQWVPVSMGNPSDPEKQSSENSST